ncbi:MAG TPA: YkvA family protein [Sphingomonadaceae bacterium]|nr:YkvA family protein [Sphingomonadaceae bacterium]
MDVLALWIAARSPLTPTVAKIVAATVAAYALSPIDLIPDFVPVLGYLDDLVLVPLGIAWSVRLIPPPLMRDFRRAAERFATRPRSRATAVIVVALWLAMALGAALWWSGTLKRM